jgi:hypothetical protein
LVPNRQRLTAMKFASYLLTMMQVHTQQVTMQSWRHVPGVAQASTKLSPDLLDLLDKILMFKEEDR